MISNTHVPEEPDWRDSPSYHAAGRKVTQHDVMIKVLKASYEALIVDEYQDCQIWQHELIVSISEVLPTAVFGDRMQGLLFFGENRPVSWEADVQDRFAPIELPVTPHRWIGRNDDLGNWLLEVREAFIRGDSVDLSSGPLKLVGMKDALAAFHEQPRHPTRTCGIARFPNDCHLLASRLGGAYTMIEELEGRVMLAFADVVDRGLPGEVAQATLEFAVTSAYGVAEAFTVEDRERLGLGRALRGVRAARSPDQAAVLNELLEGDCSPSSVRHALDVISTLPRFRLFRREAWIGMGKALAVASEQPELTVRQCVVLQRNRLRLTGRHPESRILARPLLIKGLEFDCAVVVEADRYNAHELYVAMSRGRDQLTVVSRKSVVTPPRPG